MPRIDFKGVEKLQEHEGAGAEVLLGDQDAGTIPGWGPGPHPPLDHPRCHCGADAPHPVRMTHCSRPHPHLPPP